MNMKLMLITTLAVIGTAITGCKTVPTTDTVYTTAKAVGVSAALVCNQTKIDDESRNAIVRIMNDVEMSTPMTNQTFESAWTPIATSHIGELIHEGKITETQGELIKSAFTTAVKGLDYVVNVRYPKIRTYNELLEATTHGFCEGFLTYFKPVNAVSTPSKTEFDVDAYNYMMKLSTK